MKTLPQTAFALREASLDNIKKYCERENAEFTEVRKYLTEKADTNNTLIPIDFYLRMYNLSVQLLNNEPFTEY